MCVLYELISILIYTRKMISFFQNWFRHKRKTCKDEEIEICGTAAPPSSFSDAQRSILLEKFSINGYPSSSEITLIADQINDVPDRVKVAYYYFTLAGIFLIFFGAEYSFI